MHSPAANWLGLRAFGVGRGLHDPTGSRKARVFVPFLVGMAYYMGAKLGFALTFHPYPVSVLWPPNSILLAALLLIPRRDWWRVLAVVLPFHWFVQTQSSVPASMILC